MIALQDEHPTRPHGVELEATLQVLEHQLATLRQALCTQDGLALDRAAADLQSGLSTAVARFSHAARHGGVPPALRQRLAAASAQVAAQREALARATASLDRAIEVLLPGVASGGLYSAAGADRNPYRRGLIQA